VLQPTGRGQFETHEGVVNFDPGAYLNQDSKGRVWPIDAATFRRDYKLLLDRVADECCPMLLMGIERNNPHRSHASTYTERAF
jgi:hypothetical protein